MVGLARRAGRDWLAHVADAKTGRLVEATLPYYLHPGLGQIQAQAVVG